MTQACILMPAVSINVYLFIYLFIFQVSYFGLCYLQILNEQKRFFFLLLFVKRFMFENNIACCV